MSHKNAGVGTERSMPPLMDVDAFPDAASPYGLLDLVGNIYQWSDRFVDDHTAKAVLRGASSYHPGTRACRHFRD